MQTFLHLFTPLHTSVTICVLHAMAVLIEFSPCKSCYFSILRPILLKLHILPHLFLHFRRLLFSSLASYPAEIAYFNSPNWELSNGVQVMKLYWNRNVDHSRSPCLKIVDRKRFVRRNFLVLCPVLLKIAYFSSANRQLSDGVRYVELR